MSGRELFWPNANDNNNDKLKNIFKTKVYQISAQSHLGSDSKFCYKI